MPVSAVDCIQPALQHARAQLFRPFRFGQWSRLAVVGFLAAELHTSGCNFNGLNFPTSSHPRRGNQLLETAPFFPHFNPAHIAQFVGLIVAVVALAIVLGLIFLYIGSVFRFILFESVLKKDCSISEGWPRWQRAGGRYFLWQIVLIIAQGLFLGVLIGVPLALAVALGWFRNVDQHIARTILGAIFLVAVFLMFLLVVAAVQLLAKDFLVPIMALDDVDFADGWSRLLALIRSEPGNYIIYLLLKIVLSIAAGIVVGIVTLVPIFILVVPAVVAVFTGYKAGLGWNVTTVSLAIIFGTIMIALLLCIVSLINVPAAVFFPAFSIYFFASRYPKLDAISNPPAPAPQLPPVIEPTPPAEPPPLPPIPEVIS